MSVVWLHVSQEKDCGFGQSQFIGERFLEKYIYVRVHQSVPQTDTGGKVEKTKAHERNMVQELGKTATVTSG